MSPETEAQGMIILLASAGIAVTFLLVIVGAVLFEIAHRVFGRG